MANQTTAPIALPDEIQNAIDAGAVIVLSMSGGKDSQAMASAVVDHVVAHGLTNKLVAVHADLGRAEWFDTMATLEAQMDSLRETDPTLELEIVRRPQGDLLDRIQQRADAVGETKVFWPSSAARYCTGELKRNQIDKFLRTLGPLVISAEGLRREESTARARKDCWEPRKQISNSKRDALTWRPINDWTLEDVWTEIGGPDTLAALEDLRRQYAAGFEDHALEAWSLIAPFAHDAYVRGNDRLSCSLCVLATRSDIENGARHNPEYFQALVELEERYGWTFKQDLSLVELAKKLEAEEIAAEAKAAVDRAIDRRVRQVAYSGADRRHATDDDDEPTDGIPEYQLIGLTDADFGSEQYATCEICGQDNDQPSTRKCSECQAYVDAFRPDGIGDIVDEDTSFPTDPMTYYMGEQSNGSRKLLEDLLPRGIGRCFVHRPMEPFPGEPTFVDNGVFPVWQANDRDPDTDYTDAYARFQTKLERAGELAAEGRGPDFVVAPDRPGHPDSLETSVAWVAEYEADLERMGLPVYLAVQDGMTAEQLADDPILDKVAGLFLGGTDDFKETAAEWSELAQLKGLGFHWARCTQSLLAKAVAIGCTSADSAHPLRLGGDAKDPTTRWGRWLEVFDTVVAGVLPQPEGA